MSSTINLVCRYDNSNIEDIGKVYCPNTILRVPKKTFHSLGKNDYHCPQCPSTCQLRSFPFEEKPYLFFLKSGTKGFNSLQ